ncbi:MAG: hypothetical protein M1820_009285 [Bogoriella megaspora]|nr:MAG: hypothetical protein M1820_009285 [Bogoriella megaspora]
MLGWKRKPQCFYCGATATKINPPGTRAWECRNCEATNHLDENGNFTDPPPAESDSPFPVQSRNSYRRSTSPNYDFSDDRSVFCRTCQQNQHIVREALAEYLPPPEDPRYREFERAYPEFKKNLEIRYPLFCKNCAPKAQARKEQADYFSMTDHLRRKMGESKRNERNAMALSLLNWRSIVIFTAGLAWWASMLGEIIWHIFGIAMPLPEYRYFRPEGLKALSTLSLLGDCSSAIRREHQVTLSCLNGTRVIGRRAFGLALLSFWWNHRLRDKIVDKRAGRMKGLFDYYKLQSIVLLARWAAVSWLDFPESLGITPQAFKGAHALMLFFLTITTLNMSRMVKLDRSQPFSLQRGTEPLIAPNRYEDDLNVPNQDVHPAISEWQAKRNRQQRDQADALHQRGRAQMLHSQKPTPFDRIAPSPGDPITPPESENDVSEPHLTYDSDGSAMEWTPTQPTFQPRHPIPTHSISSSTTSTPAAPPYQSPFYGTLPATPRPPAYRIYHPLQSQTQPRTEPRNYFAERAASASSNDSLAAAQFGGREDAMERRRREKPELVLKESKWFLESDHADTGLEGVFETVFSLSDEPREVSSRRRSGGGGLIKRVFGGGG